MRNAVLLMLLCLLAVSAEAKFMVRSIEVHGLKRTRSWVVERELHFAPGDSITSSDLETARKRLYNLSVFNDATVTADSSGRVIVDVAELWPILPIVSLSLDRGDFVDIVNNPKRFWSNLNILAGVRHLNFRGNAADLYAYGQLGSSNGFYIGYQTRWFSPRLPYAVRASVQHLNVTDRHASVLDSSRRMRDNGGALRVGTQSDARRRAGLEARSQHVRQSKAWPSEGRTLDMFWLSPYLILDYRDLVWWPSRGGVFESTIDFGTGTEESVRSRYGLRGYFPIPSWYSVAVPHRPMVLALQLTAATSTSATPSFAHYYSGFEDGYRGYRNVETEAATVIAAAAEFRFPITREGTYNVPFIGQYGRQWPLGLSGVLYVQRVELQLDNTRRELLGYGGGIYVRVPYVQIAELAVARNKDRHAEFTLKLGVAF